MGKYKDACPFCGATKIARSWPAWNDGWEVISVCGECHKSFREFWPADSVELYSFDPMDQGFVPIATRSDKQRS